MYANKPRQKKAMKNMDHKMTSMQTTLEIVLQFFDRDTALFLVHLLFMITAKHILQGSSMDTSILVQVDEMLSMSLLTTHIYTNNHQSSL